MTTGFKNTSPYYLDLVTEFAPRPIMNEEGFRATQQRINLILKQKNLNEDEKDYLRVLGMLIFDYEERNEKFPKLTDKELLQTLIEEYNLNHQDLLGIFKQEQVILDILNGKRSLNSKESFKVRSLIL
ncbi:helix-turn-helix domain-containing protein [Crocosphaera sp.]|uniref:helix-turn-helix domain-containing protein n=1 Tax=Crocosphaera sp. TaxID=2729996 RepID=UPI003F26AAEE